jgi:regulatory protein YycI of two-component signal transduction system YycFG
MNFNNIDFSQFTTGDWCVTGFLFILIVYTIFITLAYNKRRNKLAELQDEVSGLDDELKHSNLDRDAWYKKFNNKSQQCDRLTGEKEVLKTKVKFLEDKSSKLETKVKFIEAVLETKVKLIEAIKEDNKPTAKIGRNTPSRKKDGGDERTIARK